MLGPSCRGTGLWFISDTLTARAFSPHSSDSPNYSPGNSSVQEPALRPCLLHTEVRGGGERREKLAGDRLNPLKAGRAPPAGTPGPVARRWWSRRAPRGVVTGSPCHGEPRSRSSRSLGAAGTELCEAPRRWERPRWDGDDTESRSDVSPVSLVSPVSQPC